MANKHAVVRTDLMYATDVRSGLVSVKYMGKEGGTPTAIDNGHVVLLQGLDGDEREIYLGTDVKKDSDVKSVALIATPEVMYDEQLRNLDDYYNEADKPLRGYLLHNGDIFSVTKEALTGAEEPKVGDTVELTEGTQLNVATSATEGNATIGEIIEVAMAGRYKYYAIEIDTAKNAKATDPIGHYGVPELVRTKDFGEFGKVTDFLEPDVHVDWDGTTGSVIGTFKYVRENKKFSGDESHGYYYPIVLSDQYKGKEITVHEKSVGQETEIILYLGKILQADKKVTIKCGDTLIATLDFSKATFPDPINVTVKKQSDDAGYGTKKVSEIMAGDVGIHWDSTNGKVTGTFYKVDDWNELPKDPKSGHFFAMNIDRYYLGKPFEFIKGDASSGSKAEQAGEDEMFWVLRIDDEKKFTFKSGEETIATLDFTSATLE